MWYYYLYFELLCVYFSLDIRDRSIEQGKHWSDDRTLGSRAYFMVDPPQSFLTIDSVEETDMGIYKCRVDFKYSPTKNYNANLTVIGELLVRMCDAWSSIPCDVPLQESLTAKYFCSQSHIRIHIFTVVRRLLH